MKKLNKIVILFFIMMSICLTPVMLFTGGFSNSGKVTLDTTEEISSGNKNLNEAVLRYKSDVEAAAKKFGIPDKVSWLLAIMMVESGGKGLDPMQSSESKGLPMNTIASPKESIEAGAEHLANTVRLTKELDVDPWIAIGAYNYGVYYVKFMSQNGKKYNIDIAEKYSREVVAPSLGNHSGEKYSYVNDVSLKFNKTYLYWNGGNYFYTELVKQYLGPTNKVTGSSGKYILPVDNPIISSPFGNRLNPKDTSSSEFHRGLDFANPYGSNIKAIQSGTVIVAESHYSWGDHVVIQHPDGKVSLYAHQSQILVRVGDKVKQGQVIGKIGSTGNSTGPHLHLEIAKSTDLSVGNLLDPKTVLGL